MKKLATLTLVLCFGFGMIAGITGCSDVADTAKEKATDAVEVGTEAGGDAVDAAKTGDVEGAKTEAVEGAGEVKDAVLGDKKEE